MKVTLLRQSMLLGQSAQVTFLVDPFFKVFHFPVKIPPASLALEDVPPCSVVLVTHGDFDHFDLEIVARRWPDVPVVVPLGLEAQAARQGARQVVALPPWQTFTHADLTITAVPAKHCDIPACGYVIAAQTGQRFYTAGDTLWAPALADIPARCGALAAAFIPVIGIRMWGQQTIWSSAEAAQAMATLKPAVVVPVHLDAFIQVPLVGGMLGSVAEFERALRNMDATIRIQRLVNGEQIEL